MELGGFPQVKAGSWAFPKRKCCAARSGASVCCLASFFPCCLMAKAKHMLDGTNSIYNCCCVCPPSVRTAVRTAYHIDGDVASDTIFTCCCLPCAAAQCHNEVSFRGPTAGPGTEMRYVVPSANNSLPSASPMFAAVAAPAPVLMHPGASHFPIAPGMPLSGAVGATFVAAPPASFMPPPNPGMSGFFSPVVQRL